MRNGYMEGWSAPRLLMASPTSAGATTTASAIADYCGENVVVQVRAGADSTAERRSPIIASAASSLRDRWVKSKAKWLRRRSHVAREHLCELVDILH
jgi:hypothetical protein